MQKRLAIPVAIFRLKKSRNTKKSCSETNITDRFPFMENPIVCLDYGLSPPFPNSPLEGKEFVTLINSSWHRPRNVSELEKDVAYGIFDYFMTYFAIDQLHLSDFDIPEFFENTLQISWLNAISIIDKFISNPFAIENVRLSWESLKQMLVKPSNGAIPLYPVIQYFTKICFSIPLADVTSSPEPLDNIHLRSHLFPTKLRKTNGPSHG